MPSPKPFVACLLATTLTGCGGNQGEILTVAAAVASAVLAGQAARSGSTSGAPPTTGMPTISLPGIPTATPTGADPTVLAGGVPSGPADAQLQKALAAANVARAAAGAKPLVWSQPLAVLALRHSQDMADHDFFDHTNPAGQSPFDRMKAGGIKYGAAAENIAINFSDSGDEVIQQWLDSPGHRENLLTPGYGKMGLGVVKDAEGQRLWTQTFTD